MSEIKYTRTGLALLAAVALTACASTSDVASLNPRWAEKPTGEDLARAYPAAAAARHLSGDASVSCRILASGRLAGCVVTSETPVGFGFGAATLEIARKFRAANVSGGTVAIPMRWRLN